MTDILSTVAQDAKTLFDDFTADALPVVEPAVTAFLTSIAGNPSLLNIETQGNLLLATVAANQSVIFSKFVAQFQALVTAQLNAASAAATAADAAAAKSA